MSKRYSTKLFQRVVVPVIYGLDARAAVNAAVLITDPSNIELVGIVGIAEAESLSGAALPARHVRKVLRDLASARGMHTLQRIRVSHKPWEEAMEVAQEEGADLLVMDAAYLVLLDANDASALRYPPCDVVIAGGSVPQHVMNVVVA